MLYGKAGIWDVKTGNLLFSLLGHTGSIQALAYRRDGRMLATASNDHTVKIWDPNTGLELLTLPGHTDELTGVAFTADDSRLVTTSLDVTIRVYALNVDDLIALARSRLTRELTETECLKYLHEKTCSPEPKTNGT